MLQHLTGFRLWAFIYILVSPIIAAVVPRQFDGMGWLWVLVPPAIPLSVITAVCFAFMFTDPKLTQGTFRVSRFSRATAVLLTCGFGWLASWFLFCASKNGCSSRLAVVPGVATLGVALFILFRFRYEISSA
jgi:hypothetical protein